MNKEKMKNQKDELLFVSSVDERDGLGIEVWRNDELLIEIFRDDGEEIKTVTLYKEVSLEFMEECIEIFKKEIPRDYSK